MLIAQQGWHEPSTAQGLSRTEQAEDNPLRVLSMSAGQQVLSRLGRAFREFLKGQCGKPRFKRTERFNSVIFKPGDGASLKGWKLYFQNVSLVSVRWHRDPPDSGMLKNIILLRKPSGGSCCKLSFPARSRKRTKAR